MYLYKETYIGANYKHRGVVGTLDLERKENFESEDMVPIRIKLENVVSITEQFLYWRKANAIHRWFVENVQKGEDDCREYMVRRSHLEELYQLCREVFYADEEHRNEIAMRLLPPMGGFFFGSTEIDSYYYEDLEYTIKKLGIELDYEHNPDITYTYQSSW